MTARAAGGERFRQVSIRRYLTMIVLAALLPTGLLAGVLLYAFWTDQQQKSSAELLARTRTLASLLESELDSTIARLRVLASDPLLDTAALPAFHERLARVLAASEDWSNLALVSPQRQLLNAAVPYSRDPDGVPNLPFHQQAFETLQPVISDHHMARTRQQPTLTIVVPVIREGRAIFALAVAVDVMILSAKLATIVPPDGVAGLVDREYRFIARSRDPGTFIGQPIGRLLRDAMRESEAGVIRSITREGERTFTGHVRLANGFHVGLATPSRPFDVALSRSLLLLAGILLGALALGLLLSQWLVARIDRHVAQTVETASRLVAGQEVAQTPLPVRELATISDSVRRLFLREREAREQERAASRAKDEFLAMLGHELRNPLAPIVTALQLMRLRAGDALKQERGIIERQVRHMQRLVDDLLDVARIARGSIELKREPVELAAIVADALETSQPGLMRKRIVPIVAVPATGLVVDADPARLCQIVANLLTNAAKFSAAGSRVEISADRAGELAILQVADQGAGLGSDDRERIFEPFTQSKQSVDRPEGGLGLGLSIARNIARLHGGDLIAYSDGIGRGSTFRLVLPLATQPEAQAVAAAPAPAVPAAAVRPTVLIVDDNVDAAEALAELLKLWGYRTHVVHDGRDVLPLLPELAPDVILLDIGLPGLDGYQVAARIRAESRWARMRLIAVTGYGQASDLEQTRAAGFERHLVKPVDPGRLAEVLGESRPSRAASTWRTFRASAADE
ncbi:MAG: ATP-binding protein [Lautropia sp.]